MLEGGEGVQAVVVPFQVELLRSRRSVHGDDDDDSTPEMWNFSSVELFLVCVCVFESVEHILGSWFHPLLG